MPFLRRSLALVLLVTLALGGGVALASFLQSGSDEPQPRDLREVPQSASAVAGGIRVEALGAVFSGTETLVRIDAAVVDDAAVTSAIRAEEIIRVAPARTGLTGPFAGTLLSVQATEQGALLLVLPAIVPGPDYDGRVPLNLRAMNVYTPGGPTLLEGSWDLELTGAGS